MTDIGPYSNYRLTIRLQLANKPGMFARVAAVLAEEGANLGAVDIVSATADCMVRDVTFDVQSEAHGEKVLARLGALPDVEVLSASDRIFLLHLGGKIRVQSKFPITTRNLLSMVYTPGVGRVSQAIAKDKPKAYAFTSKGNTVAVVTDGSAVLGLGNLGPEAALPVMEGKAMLFKEFAGIDAFPICLATKDVDEIVRTVKLISPVFGGINLEDISAPRCFEIEQRLQRDLEIPVFHDDQHGTAVVVLAAVLNALKVVKKKLPEARIVFTGAGASGIATAKLLMKAGAKHIIGCDRAGAIYKGRKENMNSMKEWFAEHTNPRRVQGSAGDALEGADIFIGLSGPGVVSLKDIKTMNKDSIVFA